MTDSQALKPRRKSRASANKSRSPAEDPRDKPAQPVVQKRSEKERTYIAQASFNMINVAASLQRDTPVILQPIISLWEVVKEGEEDKLSSFAAIPNFIIDDPSKIFKDHLYDTDDLKIGSISLLEAFGFINGNDGERFKCAFRAAREIETALNTVLVMLNAANLTNAKRLDTAARIINKFTAALIGKSHGKTYLRARSYEGFKRLLQKEIAAGQQIVKMAAEGAVKISLNLQNSMIDAADLSSPRKRDRENSPAYKRAIQAVRGSSKELSIKRAEEIVQLKLFEEEVSIRVSTSLLHQARGNAIALVLTIMQIRQQARYYALRNGIDPTSNEPVDMIELGFPIECLFPEGLRSNRFTIVANEVLQRIGRPYQGMSGTRERKQAEKDLFEFADLKYRQEPTKGNKDRVLVHSFNMKASTKGHARYWVFENLSDDFLLPKEYLYDELDTDFISYVYEHFNGSREKAGGLIKFMTVATNRLNRQLRALAAKAVDEAKKTKKEPVYPGTVEIAINYAQNYWPKFETKSENEHAKEVMKEAFTRSGMEVDLGAERAYGITLKARITINAPLQIQ